MRKIKRLLDEYRFPGFRPQAKLKGIFGDNRARIITLLRSQKKLYAVTVGQLTRVFMTEKLDESGTCLAVMPGFIWRLKYVESIV